MERAERPNGRNNKPSDAITTWERAITSKITKAITVAAGKKPRKETIVEGEELDWPFSIGNQVGLSRSDQHAWFDSKWAPNDWGPANLPIVSLLRGLGAPQWPYTRQMVGHPLPPFKLDLNFQMPTNRAALSRSLFVLFEFRFPFSATKDKSDAFRQDVCCSPTRPMVCSSSQNTGTKQQELLRIK